MLIDLELPQGTKSYNLYKLHPPFRKLVNGHGYPGVVLERISDGKLQCHLCGSWLDNLSNHILYEHKIKVKEYKRKFGLRHKDSLVHKKIKEQLSSFSKNTMNIEQLKKASIQGIKVRQENKTQHKINKSKAMLQVKRSLAYLNEKGLCPDQINYRFDIVRQQVRRQPTKQDLRNHDDPLYTRIKQEYGTIDKYLRSRGTLPEIKKSIIRSRGTLPEIKKSIIDINLIAALRKIYLKKGRIAPEYFHSGNGVPSWFAIETVTVI